MSAVDNVEHPRRKPRLLRQLCNHHGGARVLLGRLQHKRVASCARHGEHLQVEGRAAQRRAEGVSRNDGVHFKPLQGPLTSAPGIEELKPSGKQCESPLKKGSWQGSPVPLPVLSRGKTYPKRDHGREVEGADPGTHAQGLADAVEVDAL